MEEQHAGRSDGLPSDVASSEPAGDFTPLASMQMQAALHKPAIALAVSLVILPVLYRIGFVGSLAVVVLAV